MSDQAGAAERPFPRIERRVLTSPGSLAADALAGVDTATALFGGPPGRLPNPARPPDPLKPAVLPAAAFVTTSPGARERLHRVLAGEGTVVTTGQQPGLFLGPLYTLYKAVTAVRVAETIERRTGRPALAVFWVASDDHDWDEVAACRIVTIDEQLLTLRLSPPDGHRDRSVGTAPLPAGVTQLLRRLRDGGGGAVAGAPAPWLGTLCDAYRPGRAFAEAFIRSLQAAFEGLDLAILDAAHPGVRGAAADLYTRIVHEPSAVTDAMERGRQAVRAAGYQPALTPPPEGLQMFYDDGTSRRHVLRAGDHFEAGDTSMSSGALLRHLEHDAVAFSPAAALRPVLESDLLPVTATVLGPGEITYWAQLRPLFEALDVSMPAIMPRDAWVLVEPRVDRLLDKLGIDAATVEAEGEGIDDRWIARSRPKDTGAALSSLNELLSEQFAALDAAVAREMPGLKSAAGKAAHRARQAVDELSRTVDARVREREAIALGQAARVRSHLIPDGAPQERVVAAAQFLARHGRPLVADLLRASRVAGPEGQD